MGWAECKNKDNIMQLLLLPVRLLAIEVATFHGCSLWDEKRSVAEKSFDQYGLF
jgi:hypothetical protein